MDRTLIGETSSEQEMSLEFSARAMHFGAWAVLALLIAFPAWILPFHATNSIVCFVWWAVASILAGLFAVRLATHAVPGRHKPHFAAAMAVLALVNLVFALVAMVLPSFAS